MLVMIIFLILSLVLALFTALYLNSKKKKNKNEIKTNNEQEVDKSNSKKELKDILKIKIKDSIIFNNDTRYSSIIKLGNVDYNMLSDLEQESIENILIQTALSIDYPIQFFSTTEYIDTSKVIETIKNHKTYNEKVQEYKQSLIYYLENLMENKNISIVKNYAIISYDGYFENAIDELNRRVSSFKGNLLRAKIQCEVLDENELHNLIYRELNKNPNPKIDSLLKGSEKLYVGKKQKIKK